MCTSREEAIRIKKLMEPYVEEAERNAQIMFEAMSRREKKVYETIPKDSFKNRVKRIVYYLMET